MRPPSQSSSLLDVELLAPFLDQHRKAKAHARLAVARRWDRWPFNSLGALSQSYMRAWSNSNNNLELNGEKWVLQHLIFDTRQPVLLDMGANVGNWTSAALWEHPSASVHCFEPTPAIATVLSKRFDSNSNVVVHNLALSDCQGEGTLYIDPDDSKNSLVSRSPVGIHLEHSIVPINRGDTIIEDLGIAHVDLLKIDTEGHDLSVIRGFCDTLSRGGVSVIQFEYNAFSIYSRTLLLDYYEFLGPMGFAIGKIRPNGVNFKSYDVADENWIGPDCIAVHTSRQDLVDRLSARPL